MRTFIKKIVLFFILVLATNFCYLLLIQKYDWNFKKRLEALSLESPRYDVLVLGNSLAMDGIDTELLSQKGFEAYNLAIGGASLMTSYVQLKEYISMYTHKPQYIILGLGSYMTSFEVKEIHPIVDFTRADKTYGINDLPMLKFKWIFQELLKKMVSKEHRNAYLKNGQLRFEKKMNDNTLIKRNNIFQINEYLSSEIISSILKLCTDNNIKLVVVEMPGFKNVRHQKIVNYFMLDKNNSNGILLDCNTIEFCEIFSDQTDWIGNSHLNELGASKFTSELLNDLEKIRHKGIDELLAETPMIHRTDSISDQTISHTLQKKPILSP